MTAPKPTTWTLLDRNGQIRRIVVAARTQAQRDKAKANFENPPPPDNHKRHGQLDALR